MEKSNIHTDLNPNKRLGSILLSSKFFTLFINSTSIPQALSKLYRCMYVCIYTYLFVCARIYACCLRTYAQVQTFHLYVTQVSIAI
jgi:hypothetical protein